MNHPTLSILIISYNTREMTIECIRSVFDQTSEIGFELIVLDNASSDGSADAIEGEFGERVRLFRSEDNLGFAGGNNEAAKHAEGEYLLLLNPDTVVLDVAIDKLVAFAASHEEAGLWGGRTVFADGSLNPMSAWGRMTIWSLVCRALGLSAIFSGSRLFNPEAIAGWDRGSDRFVDILTGCFLLLKTDLWRKLDGFDPRFFMYGEEADLCLRAAKSGFRSLATGSATIIHYGGASERVRADKMVRLLKAKNQLIDRHFGTVTRPLGRVLLSAWPASRVIAHGFAAMIGRDKSKEGYETWRTIWRRRAEWRSIH